MARSRARLGPIVVAERKARALRLRKAGYTYEEIARAIPTYRNASQAGKEVRKCLAEMVSEPAKELIDLELQRLDRALRAIWRDVTAGDVKAIDRMLAIMRQRARYMGLNWVERKDSVEGMMSEIDRWLEATVDDVPEPEIDPDDLPEQDDDDEYEEVPDDAAIVRARDVLRER